jgi:hypothetical protein
VSHCIYCYAEFHYAGYRYAECPYAECRGAMLTCILLEKTCCPE